MKRYVVYEPKDGAPHTGAGAEKLIFVREGFSWAAFLFTVPWLLFRRAWLGLLVWILLAALVVVAGILGVGGANAVILMILVGLVIGFEAPWFRAMSLTRRGYRPLGIVTAATQIEAERAFFADWLTDGSSASPAEPSAERRASPPRYQPSSAVLGLFPQPESGR